MKKLFTMIFAFTVSASIAQFTGQINLGASFSQFNNLRFSQQVLIGYNLKGENLNLRLRVSLANSPYTKQTAMSNGNYLTQTVDNKYADFGGSVIYSKGLIQIENGLSLSNDLVPIYNSGLFIKLRNRLYLGVTNSYFIGTERLGYKLNRTGLCISMSN
jgi:hypothetical protein